MSLTEVLKELRKLRGKFLKDEGIYIVSKPFKHIIGPLTLSTGIYETETVDLSVARQKIIFFVNNHDADANVEVLSGYDMSGTFVSIAPTITVPANSAKIAIMSRDLHRYLKFKLSLVSPPSKGEFLIVILGVG